VKSRATAVHVDADEFLEACRKELERRTRKPVTIAPTPSTASDYEAHRLQGELLDAELHEKAKRRLFDGAQRRLADAQAATRVARAALDAHLARAKAAA